MAIHAGVSGWAVPAAVNFHEDDSVETLSGPYKPARANVTRVRSRLVAKNAPRNPSSEIRLESSIYPR
jgi:transcription antitermination factor NusG